MRGLFVTGTDTGVGKTILCAALLAAMAAEGWRVRAHKPAVTGLEDRAEIAARGAWPPDHELLAAAAGMNPEEVAPLRYGPAVSPRLAAQLAGDRIDPQRLISAARGGAPTDDTAGGHVSVVEGIGGLLTPLAEDLTVRDLAAALELPVLIAARPGLGTINHTLLTLEAARAADLDVRAVVLTPWPATPARIERSNRETIGALGGIEVECLGLLDGPDLDGLAGAGATLPWQRWLGRASAA